MTFREWLKTEAGRMVSFEKMPRMLEIVWNASAEAERDEARRQLTEAQHAIDVLSNTVVAQDAMIKQLEQARSDIEDYRFRVNELFKACKAARDWFARNTNQDHTPGPVEKMLIDATQVEATA